MEFHNFEHLSGGLFMDQFIVGELGTIPSIDGGQGFDTLQVDAGPKENTWTISGFNDDSVSNDIWSPVGKFSSVALLIGGETADHFEIDNGAVLSVGIQGQGGVDTLRINETPGLWRLTGRNRGTVID